MRYTDVFSEPIEVAITLTGAGIIITDDSIIDFSLHESLCSEPQLRFGACESSYIVVEVEPQAVDLTGKVLTLYFTPTGQSAWEMGVFKVAEVKKDSLSETWTITAYDKMRDLVNADVSEWYAGLTFPMTLEAFRNSFAAYLGIAEDTVGLDNDDVTLERTISGRITGGKVLQAICELNGVFGHITTHGLLEYATVNNDDVEVEAESFYNYEIAEKDTEEITGLIIRENSDDVGHAIGTRDNAYIIENNFLTFGMSDANIETILDNLWRWSVRYQYRPATVEMLGNPAISLGDNLLIMEDGAQICKSLVLEHTMSGVQFLDSEIGAQGTEGRENTYNSLGSQVEQLAGRTASLDVKVDGIVGRVEETVEVAQNAQEVANGASATAGAAATAAGNAQATANSAANAAAGVASNLQKNYSTTLQTAQAITAEVGTRVPVEGGSKTTNASWSLKPEGFIVYSNGAEVLRVDGTGLHISGNNVISWNSLTDKDGVVTDSNKATKIGNSFIKTLNLEVGTEITMGDNATIKWGKVDGRPTQLGEFTNDQGYQTSQQVSDTATSAANTAVNNLEIGGKNTLTKARYDAMGWWDMSAIDKPAECPYGFFGVGKANSVGYVRIPNVVDSNGWWTVSFDMKGTQDMAWGMPVDLCDMPAQTVRANTDNQWHRYSLTFNVTNYSEVYNFLDFEVPWVYVYVRNIKVEKGNKATDWTPAPEDIWSTEIGKDWIKTSQLEAQNLNITGGGINLNDNFVVDNNGNATIKKATLYTPKLSALSYEDDIIIEGNVIFKNAGSSEVQIGTSTDRMQLDVTGDIECDGTVYSNNKKVATEDINAWTKVTLNLTSGSTTFSVNGYNTVVLKGRTHNTAGWQTLVIPVAAIGATGERWAIVDGNNYIAATLSISGTTVTIAKDGSTSTGSFECVFLQK